MTESTSDQLADEVAGAVIEWAGGDPAALAEGARIVARTPYLGPTRWSTADGSWRVSLVELDGRKVLRVETRGLLGWTWRADARSADEVAQYVPLSELTEEGAAA